MKISKLTVQRFFIVYLIVVFVLHVMKTDDVVDLNSYFLGIRRDHWAHGIIFFPMGFFALISLNKNQRLAFAVIVFCCFFFESLQYFIPYRSFDIWDIVADSIGAGIGVLAYFMTKRFLPAHLK